MGRHPNLQVRPADRRLRLPVLCLALALAATSCAGNDPSPGSATEPPTPSTSSSQTPIDPSPSEGAQPFTLGPIPADLDLTSGLPEDGGDYDVTPATPDGDGIGEIEVCGERVWPDVPGFEGRLVVNASGPEYGDTRELWVLEDADTAVGVVETVRTAVEGCSGDGHRVWTAYDADTGYDSATFGLTWTDGLGSSVFQLTRVGRGLLMTHHYTEGSLESAPRTVSARTELTRELAPSMCPFTRTGC